MVIKASARISPPHSQPRALRHVTTSHTSQETSQSRLSRRLNAFAGRGSPHPSSCTPPTNLGLVGARTARHDREPGGLQVRVRVSLAGEKGHQATAFLAGPFTPPPPAQRAVLAQRARIHGCRRQVPSPRSASRLLTCQSHQRQSNHCRQQQVEWIGRKAQTE